VRVGGLPEFSGQFRELLESVGLLVRKLEQLRPIGAADGFPVVRPETADRWGMYPDRVV
jgi:hypothetical protein